MDHRSGESQPAGTAKAIDSTTLTHTVDERNIVFFDGPSLQFVNPSTQRGRGIYEIPSDWERSGGFALPETGMHAAFVEKKGGASRLRMVPFFKGSTDTVYEAEGAIEHLAARPKRSALACIDREGAVLIDLTTRKPQRLKVGSGKITAAQWSADGKTLLYILIPAESGRLNQLREYDPDANTDKLIASTSQFVNFARNSDTTVFAGVSSSKPSPHILLLLRASRREMTICEHRASDPNRVVVLFAPNSQRVLFHTDRQGKSAIYSVPLERFVEKTEI
jgi:oligogalacturonide lyase